MFEPTRLRVGVVAEETTKFVSLSRNSLDPLAPATSGKVVIHTIRGLRPRRNECQGFWLALVMNRDSRGSHPSVERRRRRLLVVIRTERLLFHGVEAIGERLEKLPVLCGKAVGKLRNLHLALR